MSTEREEDAEKALALFGVRAFVDFLRLARKNPGCKAVELACEAIDEGSTVQDLFFTGEEYGYQLSVDEIGEQKYRVAFGCQAGPLAGDGGTWDVTVDREGDIVRAVRKGSWVS